MAEYTVAERNYQFRGWHALLAIVALGGFFGIKMYMHVVSVDQPMRDALREELQKEYSGLGPKDVTRILNEAAEGQPVEPLPPAVQHDIEFKSIAACGTMGKPVKLVRVEITVDGGPPPDGRSVRYFQMETKFVGDGWMVIGESSSYRYFSALMP
jgi:hypothetical protein